MTNNKRALARAFSIYGFWALLILVVAPFMAEGAGKIADLTGLGKTSARGLRVLAVATGHGPGEKDLDERRLLKR